MGFLLFREESLLKFLKCVVSLPESFLLALCHRAKSRILQHTPGICEQDWWVVNTWHGPGSIHRTGQTWGVCIPTHCYIVLIKLCFWCRIRMWTSFTFGGIWTRSELACMICAVLQTMDILVSFDLQSTLFPLSRTLLPLNSYLVSLASSIWSSATIYLLRKCESKLLFILTQLLGTVLFKVPRKSSLKLMKMMLHLKTPTVVPPLHVLQPQISYLQLLWGVAYPQQPSLHLLVPLAIQDLALGYYLQTHTYKSMAVYSHCLQVSLFMILKLKRATHQSQH